MCRNAKRSVTCGRIGPPCLWGQPCHCRMDLPSLLMSAKVASCWSIAHRQQLQHWPLLCDWCALWQPLRRHLKQLLSSGVHTVLHASETYGLNLVQDGGHINVYGRPYWSYQLFTEPATLLWIFLYHFISAGHKWPNEFGLVISDRNFVDFLCSWVSYME